MRRPLAVLLALALAATPLAACGEEETAETFCQDHGGLVADSMEPDGDATCQDGTEYEAEAEESESDKKKSKGSKSGKRR